MLTTNFVPGSPNWIDLGSSDVDGSVAFYGSVLGWSFQSAGPDAGGYGFFQVAGKTVAAVGPLTEEGASPAWMIYFMTPDADAVEKKVEQAGGVIRVPAFDVFTAGRMAHFTDPGGSEFAVWQPGETVGLDLVTAPGSLGWMENYTAAPDEIVAFYEAVFDWQIERQAMGEFTYIMASPAQGGESSGFAGFMPTSPGVVPGWLPYFEVPDTDAAIATAQAGGGSVLSPAYDIPDVGRFAILTDPQGARFAVIKSSNQP